jgi:endonuclease/exonuclease/phosphatase (EEP) superfamily protein YafD
VVAVAVACGGSLVPIWPLSLLEHFRLQYVIAGVAIVGCAAALRLRGWFDAAAIVTLVHFAFVAPDLCRTPRPIPVGGVRVRVLLLNVLTENRGFAAVRRLIDDTRPDVIALIEVDARWLAALAPSTVRYAGRLEAPRGDNFGVALYTRGPLDGSIETLGGSLPGAVATTHLGALRLGLILVHPLPPVRSASLVAQRAVLDAAADRARSLPAPVVMMGDFNATPWSTPFRRVVARSGLCDSRAGFGVQATFPSGSFALRIPIDHLLASCSVGVADRWVAHDVGSDHLPVVVDLVVPP